MTATLDGRISFDDSELEIRTGSPSRDAMERSVPGLDGVLSIDLGGRGRRIKQQGILRARSRSEMHSRISAISAEMNGKTHKLVTNRGEEFDNLRIDSFTVNEEYASGSKLCCDYEIIYRQLENWA